jgi:hypothetical protein
LVDFCLAHTPDDDLSRLTSGVLLAESVRLRPPESIPAIFARACEFLFHEDVLVFTLGCVLLLRIQNAHTEIDSRAIDRVCERARECANDDAFTILGNDENPARAPVVVDLALQTAIGGDISADIIKAGITAASEALARITTPEVNPTFLNDSLIELFRMAAKYDFTDAVFSFAATIVSYAARVGISVMDVGLPIAFDGWIHMGSGGDPFGVDFAMVISKCFDGGENVENDELKVHLVEMLLQRLGTVPRGSVRTTLLRGCRCCAEL